MENKNTLNSFQFFLLVTNYLVGSALVFTPTLVVHEAKQDGWISLIMATIMGSFFIILNVNLIKKYPGTSIVQICEKIFSKPIGKFLGLAYIWFFLYLSAILLREISTMISITVLPQTPYIVTSILFSILLYYASYKGLQTIGRTIEMFTILSFIGFFLTILFVSPLMEINNILPVLNEGFSPIYKGGFLLLGFTYSEIIVFFMLLSNVKKPTNTTKLLIGGSILASTFLLIMIITSLFVLGPEAIFLTPQSPIILARLINIGDFFARVEVLLIMSYILTIFIKLVVTFYAGIVAFSQVFNVKSQSNFIFPITLFVISVSVLIFDNSSDFNSYITSAWTPFALCFSFFIPLILLIIFYIKKLIQKKI